MFLLWCDVLQMACHKNLEKVLENGKIFVWDDDFGEQIKNKWSEMLKTIKA